MRSIHVSKLQQRAVAPELTVDPKGRIYSGDICVAHTDPAAVLDREDLMATARLLAHAYNQFGGMLQLLEDMVPLVNWFHEREGCPITKRELEATIRRARMVKVQ
jgi:hypothetical protein